MSTDTVKLVRQDFTDESTGGEIVVDGLNQCWSLEPTSRRDTGNKMAIPAGKYELVMYDSPHFGFKVPLLLKVPGHDFVEIHPGNCPADTHDCILPGYTKGTDFVGNSKNAWEDLVVKIQSKLKNGPTFIEIIGGAV